MGSMAHRSRLQRCHRRLRWHRFATLPLLLGAWSQATVSGVRRILLSAGLGVALLGFIATLIGAGWGLTGIGVISLSLGIIENIGMVVLSSQWKQVILFGIIVLLLVIRPKGLFKTAGR